MCTSVFTVPIKYKTIKKDVLQLIAKYKGRSEKRDVKGGVRYSVTFDDKEYHRKFRDEIDKLYPDLYKY